MTKTRKPAKTTATKTAKSNSANLPNKTAKKTAPKKKPTAKIVAVRPGGEKWAAAKELLMARGGAAKADLFSVLRWRSMDVKQLGAKTGLTVTKDEATGQYIGK